MTPRPVGPPLPDDQSAPTTADVVLGVLDGGRRAVAAGGPAAPAIVAGRRTLTHAELADRVQNLSQALRDKGFGPGEVMLLSVRPGPDAVVLALAVAALGGVLVVADPGAGPEIFAARNALTASALKRPGWAAAASVLYTLSGPAAWQTPLRAVAARRGLLLPGYAALPVRHLRSGPWLPGTPRGARSLTRLAARPAGRTARTRDPAGQPGLSGQEGHLDRVGSREPALVVFTSGTTGLPQAVVHSRATLGASLWAAASAIDFAPGDRVVTDQLMIALAALAGGATWFVPRIGHHPLDLARRLHRHAATHAFTTPVAWDGVLRSAGRRGVPHALPSSLRWVLTGGAPVPQPLLARLAQAAPAARVLALYGATEMLPAAVVDAPTKAAHEGPGDLVGTLLPGVAARLGERDEVFLTAPHLCEGYLTPQGISRVTELPTGDRGRLGTTLDGATAVVLTGRLEDMIIRGSTNIYPGLFEPALAAVPGVADCALVGLPDPDTWDERVVLAVALDTDTSEAGTAADVLARLRQRLPQVMDAACLPDEIRVVGELPRSGRSRKLDRGALADQLAHRPDRDNGSTPGNLGHPRSRDR